MTQLAARIQTALFAAQDKLLTERGDGPVDNSVMISIGVGAAVVLGAAITAAIAKYTGKF